MRRGIWNVLVLLCLLPSVVGAQSINYYPAAGGGGMTVADVAAPISIPTATTSLEALRSWTIPANTFPSSTYAGFVTTCYSRAAANGNSKVVRLYFGGIAGTAILTETSATSAQYFVQTATCIVDTATTFMCSVRREIASGNAASSFTYTFNPAVSLGITCAAITGTAAADITLTGQTSYWLSK
jgi:hypothetical protein